MIAVIAVSVAVVPYNVADIAVCLAGEADSVTRPLLRCL